MWTLRRASSSLKVHKLTTATFCLPCGSGHLLPRNVEGNSSCSVLPSVKLQHTEFHRSFRATSAVSGWKKSIPSQSEAKSRETEDDSDDMFSELETPLSNAATNHNEDTSDTEPEGSDIEDDNMDSLEKNITSVDAEAQSKDENTTLSKKSFPDLFLTVKGVPPSEVSGVLNKWLDDGKELDREIISLTIFNLRKFRLYKAALQVYEWLRSHEIFELVERDYASHLDLIAKVRGLEKAESFVDSVPEECRGEVLYRTLLANCVGMSNLRKSEEVFNKMKDLELPLSAFSCNQLILLYKRANRKKIADVLLLMEKENIKPTLFTYRILMSAKGSSNDISGMDQVYEAMKADGIEPDSTTKSILARFYAYGGLVEKAESVLKELEGENVNEQRQACKYILPIYAHLGRADEVQRLWKICEDETRYEEYFAAIEAWGKLKRVDEAEAVFNKMKTSSKRLLFKQYSTLLKVYVENKELNKAKDLVRKMCANGIEMTSLTWNDIVRLYVENGEVEKADSLLSKAVEQTRLKPMFSSYIAIMDEYAKRGDVYNTEKIFLKMKECGYDARARQFSALLLAYITAKSPAYGMKERMKAHNIFPSSSLASQLVKVDPFKRNSITDILD